MNFLLLCPVFALVVAKGASRAEDPPSREHALLAPYKQRGAGGGR